MSFRHGKNAQISVNSVDLSTFCDNLELSIDNDVAETTTFQSDWKTNIAGLLGAAITLSGNYDPTATSGPCDVLMGIIIAGSAVAVVHKPGGTASGQRTNSFNALVSNYSESSAVGDKVTFAATLTVTGAVTPSTQ